MKEQTGATYTTAKYAKALSVAEAKEGKSCFLVASALGVLPWQKNGGVVDRPDHLHILTFDQGALTGIARFLTESCKAPKEALNYHVYNFQDDVRRAATADEDYDFTIFNSVIATIGQISEKAKQGGTHAVIISSLTRMVQAIQRGLFGPPALRDAHEDDGARRKSKGQADQNKWGKFAQLVAEVRDYCQVDDFHCIWEGHIQSKRIGEGQNAVQTESLAIQGQSAYNFAINVEQVFRIRRSYGQKHPGTQVDQTYLDCTPSLDFIANGRSFTEAGLTDHEMDLTSVLHRLGLKVGMYGRKSAPAKPATQTK